jgi:hypothetical protein
MKHNKMHRWRLYANCTALLFETWDQELLEILWPAVRVRPYARLEVYGYSDGHGWTRTNLWEAGLP